MIEVEASNNIENLLNNYIFYCNKLKNIEKKIKKIENDGYTILHKNSVGDLVQITHKFKDHIEKIEEKLESLENVRARLLYIKKQIETALEVVRQHKHFQIIILFYFEKKTIKEICERLGIGKDTFRKSKKEMLGIIKNVIEL